MGALLRCQGRGIGEDLFCGFGDGQFGLRCSAEWVSCAPTARDGPHCQFLHPRSGVDLCGHLGPHILIVVEKATTD